MIWKRVLMNGQSRKQLKPFRQKWQSSLTITTEFNFFAFECHFNINISAEKDKTILNFEIRTAISYRKDFNFTKISNAILNFVFILPA